MDEHFRGHPRIAIDQRNHVGKRANLASRGQHVLLDVGLVQNHQLERLFRQSLKRDFRRGQGDNVTLGTKRGYDARAFGSAWYSDQEPLLRQAGRRAKGSKKFIVARVRHQDLIL